MISQKNYFFNIKTAWLIKFFVFLSVAFPFISPQSTTAGMVWETTNAPVTSWGTTVVAIRKSYGARAKIVSIDYNDPTPNPCYQLYCFYTTGVFANFSVPTFSSVRSINALGVKGIWSSKAGPGQGGYVEVPALFTAKTVGEVYTILRPYGLVPGFESLGVEGGYCDTEAYIANPNLPYYDCIFKKRWEAYSKICHSLGYGKVSEQAGGGLTPLPGQGCIGPTPPHNDCKVESGPVVLDHGELGPEQVNGHKKNESVRISCQLPTTVSVSAISNNANEKIMLRSDNSLYSTMNIDGVASSTGKNVYIPAGGASINLESTLHTVGNVEAGTFNGNGILIINIQ